MRTVLIIVAVMMVNFALAEIFSWTDENGRTVYGDNPPEETITQTFIPQPLTVIPAYIDPDEKDKEVTEVGKKNKDDTEDADKTGDEDAADADKPAYTAFKITYPTKDEVIRANDGSLFMSMQLSPALASSDHVFVYVNGKKYVENGKALSVKLEQLDRGEHNMFAVVRNDQGDVLINSNTVKFSILRNSVLQ